MEAQSVKIREEWQKALKSEFESEYFDKLVQYIKSARAAGQVIYPPGQHIFRTYDALKPEDIKVVIIGQDPYHNPEEAVGLSFSVPRGVKIPPSLRNIYKELVNDVGIEMPQHGDLSSWTKQGVFLLNAILTVEHKQPASHKNIGWQTFTDATLAYLSGHHEHIVFMLWGQFAKAKKSIIDTTRHMVLEAAHPSPLAGNAFQGCRHFSLANDYLEKCGRGRIEWSL
jgi:uracil-DNA glycosylase